MYKYKDMFAFMVTLLLIDSMRSVDYVKKKKENHKLKILHAMQ